MSYEYISLHLVFIQFHKKTCWKHDRKSCSTWLNLSEFDLIWLKTDLKKQAKLHAGVYILSWPKKKKSTAGPRSPPFPATGISWHAAPSLSQISPDSLPAAFNKTRLFLGSWPNFLLFRPSRASQQAGQWHEEILWHSTEWLKFFRPTRPPFGRSWFSTAASERPHLPTTQIEFLRCRIRKLLDSSDRSTVLSLSLSVYFCLLLYLSPFVSFSFCLPCLRTIQLNQERIVYFSFNNHTLFWKLLLLLFDTIPTNLIKKYLINLNYYLFRNL